MIPPAGKDKRRSYSFGLNLEDVKFANLNPNHAARKFKVGLKLYWEYGVQQEVAMSAGKTSSDRKRVKGAGRKPSCVELEDDILEWIKDMRSRRLRVSRKMVKRKAQELYDALYRQRNSNKWFCASEGWLSNFLKGQGNGLRRETTVGQKLSKVVVPKLVSFIAYVKAMRIESNYAPDMMYAMDETACCMDMPSATTYFSCIFPRE